jgi:hypothetical protein
MALCEGVEAGDEQGVLQLLENVSPHMQDINGSFFLTPPFISHGFRELHMSMRGTSRASQRCTSPLSMTTKPLCRTFSWSDFISLFVRPYKKAQRECVCCSFPLWLDSPPRGCGAWSHKYGIGTFLFFVPLTWELLASFAADARTPKADGTLPKVE